MIPGGTRPFGFEPVSSVLESIPAAPLGGLCVSRLAHLRAPFAGRLATCTGQGLFYWTAIWPASAEEKQAPDEQGFQ